MTRRKGDCDQSGGDVCATPKIGGGNHDPTERGLRPASRLRNELIILKGGNHDPTERGLRPADLAHAVSNVLQAETMTRRKGDCDTSATVPKSSVTS